MEFSSFSNGFPLFTLLRGITFIHKMSDLTTVIVSFALFFIYSVKFYRSSVVPIRNRGSSILTNVRFIKPCVVAKFLSAYPLLMSFIKSVICLNYDLDKVIK